jgi:hypothetical protein
MLSTCDKASPKLCHFVISMMEPSRELPISCIGPPNTHHLGQLVPVMLLEMDSNCCSIETNLNVELDQQVLNKTNRKDF